MSKKKSSKKGSKKNSNKKAVVKKQIEEKQLKEKKLKEDKLQEEAVEEKTEELSKEKKVEVVSEEEKKNQELLEDDKQPFKDFSEVDKEYEGETRRILSPKERFFQLCEKFGEMFFLNILFTVTCLPIITIGASFTALYTITFKMVRNEDVTIKRDFFRAFKSNFKQATQLWVGLMVVFGFVYWQLRIVMNTTSQKANILVGLLGIEFILLTFAVPLLFPFVARYKNTNLNMVKNSFIASFMYFGTWATVFFLWMIPVIIYYLRPTIFYTTWYLWLLFLSSFVAYTCSHRLRRMFDKIEEEPDLGKEENAK